MKDWFCSFDIHIHLYKSFTKIYKKNKTYDNFFFTLNCIGWIIKKKTIFPKTDFEIGL